MNTILAILATILFVLYVAERLKRIKWSSLAETLRKDIVDVKKESNEAQKLHEIELASIRSDAQKAVSQAQLLIEQQRLEQEKESLRERQHYEAEAQRIQDEAHTELSKAMFDITALRKYEVLRDAENDTNRQLSEAIQEATALHNEARELLEKSRLSADQERVSATNKSKELYAQAEARLNQAVRDAGNIIADADNRARQIGGDAYEALRDKQLLESAVKAIRNVVDGYGDRYVVPTRSLLDELASEFGHTAAGEALKSARDQSRRMVEQGQAAGCDYVETNRRETAIRFVVDAFNGRVDAVLSRVKSDNYGTLEQEIRDIFSLVNLNGVAFRNARILPAYLDTRLAELKWAVVVQELRLKEREEQQRIKEQIREEEKARKEYERAIREAAKEEEVLRAAMEAAQQQILKATTEQKAKYELELKELGEKLKEAEAKNQRALSMAQQTKRGRVYIISNIGSFGENVYKIGLTRRLDPMDRVRELGDSSVPFEFDVHAMIFSEDSPALESKLHKHFVEMQVNKVNYRKEFFRVDLKHIREEIEALGVDTQWTMTAKAAEYRETMAIEKVIKDNPAKRNAWIKRQLEIDYAIDGVDEAKENDTAREVV
jgi:hypothetical protein